MSIRVSGRWRSRASQHALCRILKQRSSTKIARARTRSTLTHVARARSSHTDTSRPAVPAALALTHHRGHRGPFSLAARSHRAPPPACCRETARPRPESRASALPAALRAERAPAGPRSPPKKSLLRAKASSCSSPRQLQQRVVGFSAPRREERSLLPGRTRDGRHRRVKVRRRRDGARSSRLALT